MATAKDVIAIAEGEVGYLEKKSNAQLDDKTANAGDKNFTKYSRDLVQWIGSPYSQGVAWCDQFVDWTMIKAFGLAKAKEILGGWSAYTPTSAQYFKNMNRWYTSNPQVGDQIFFKNATRINHTGLVYAVDNSKVYTIEGNTSSAAGVVANGGCVAKKSYPLNYAKIAGYGRPAYDSTSAAKTENCQNVASTTLSYPMRVVDVAQYQKNINYQSFKNAGVQGAVIKVINKNLEKESMFDTHWNGFTGVGLPCSVYAYSYATTVERANLEASAVLKVLNGRKCNIVFYDIEDKVQQGIGARLSQIINAFQKKIEDAGYKFAIYSGLSFVKSYLKPYISQFNCKDIWFARYYKGDQTMYVNSTLDYAYHPSVEGFNTIGWQYTSKGTVPGYSGNLDLSIMYGDVDAPTPTKAVSNVKYGIVTANVLNVRDKPSTLGKVIGAFKKGDKVAILGTDVASGWYKLSEGAYASNKYIQIQ